MLGRLAVIANACVCVLAFVPAQAGAAEANPFSMGGTYSLHWQGDSLEVEAHVTGEAIRESEVWNPCGGAPPGHTVQWNPYVGGYFLYGPDGKIVRSCGPPPEIRPTLPRGFTIRVSPRCLSGGSNFLSKPTVTVTPATPGTATREVVSFDVTDTFAVFAEEAPFSSFCLVENTSTSHPNRECAEFFAPDLCATEYETLHGVIGRGSLTFVRTRTPRCGAAKTAARRALARINLLANNLRRQPGLQPAREKRLDRLLVLYRYGASERVIGECK